MLFEEKVTPEFAAKVQQVADSLGIVPDWLMMVIDIETAGTFRPDIGNPHSSAIGLIQFLSSTLDGMGYTTDQVASMDAVQQLDVVQQYYRGVINQYGTIDNITDCYLAVFYPKAMGQGPDYVFPDSVYRVNSVFDTQGNGYITVGDITNFINDRLPADYVQVATINLKPVNRLNFWIGCVLLIIAIYLIWTYRK